MYVYHRYGMAFELHQQNVLVELKKVWLATVAMATGQSRLFAYRELAE